MTALSSYAKSIRADPQNPAVVMTRIYNPVNNALREGAFCGCLPLVTEQVWRVAGSSPSQAA